MHCANHTKSVAIGICKHCNRGICSDCKIDAEGQLSCSENCSNEISALTQMMENSKRMYGIGSHKKRITSGVLIYTMFSIALLSWGIIESVNRGRIDYFGFVMATIFAIAAIINHLSAKRTGLNT